MASLFNTKISNTYVGLIKTIDNAVITATLKELTDGSGNATGLSINTGGDFKATGTIEWGSLKDTGENITITKFVDEADGIANNDNDTTIPTSAAIVDYVASRITLEDLDFSGDSGTGSVDLDSQVFAITGTANQIETTASGQGLSFAFPSAGIVLPNGSTATTQSAGDNSTKIATTAYVETAVDTVDTLAEILAIGNTTGATKISVDNTSSGIDLIDDAKIRLGTGNDFEIYHDGSHSYIKDVGTGNLQIETNDLIIKSPSATETLASFATNGAVELYFNDNKKLETTSEGATITGGLTATGSSVFTGASFSDNITIADTKYAIWGDGSDFKIHHNTSDSYLQNYTGHLYIQNNSDDKDIIFQTDDGSGGVSTYLHFDGSQASGGNLYAKYPDNCRITLGDASDLYFYHDGTDTRLQNSGGDLIFDQRTDDKDMIFKCDDGSGGTTEYFRLDGGIERTILSKDTKHEDNVKAFFGSGYDLEIYHDTNNSYIKDEGTGNLYIQASSSLNLRSADGEWYMDGIANGAVNLYYDNSKKFETTSTGVTITGVAVADGLDMGDDEKIRLGDSQDLEIYHDASNSYIKDGGTGSLYIQGSNLFLQSSVNKNAIICGDSDSVDIYYNASKKFETTNTGVSVTGITDTDGITSSAEIDVDLASEGKYFEGGSGSVRRLSITTGTNTSAHALHTFNIDSTNGKYKFDINGTEEFSLDSSNASLGGNLTIAGDLTVNGTTTTVNTETLAVEDPLISMAKDNSANSVDIGFYGRYNDGSNRYLGLFSDASDSNKFKLFKGTTTEPTTTVDTSATGYEYADILLNNIEARGTNTIFGASGASNTGIEFGSNQVKIRPKGSLANGRIYRDGDQLIFDSPTNGHIFAVAGSSSSNVALEIDSNRIPTFTNGTSSGTAMYIHNYTDAIADTKTLIDFRVQASDNAPYYVGGQMGSKAEGTWTSTSSSRNGSLIFNTVTSGNNVTALTLDSSQNATLAGNLTLLSRLTFDYNGSETGNNYLETGTNTLSFKSSTGTSIIQTNFSTGATEFSGDVTLDNILLTAATLPAQNTPSISLRSTNNEIYFQAGSANVFNFMKADYSTMLVLDGTSATFAGDVSLADSKYLYLGASNDLQLYHDGSHSYIEDTGTGQLRLKSDSEIQFLSDTNDLHAKMVKDGAVELYYDNSKKFETTSTGVEILCGNSGGDAALDAPILRISNTTESSDWDVDDVVGSIEYYALDESGNAPYVTSFIKSINTTGNGTLPDGALSFGTCVYNTSGGAVETMRLDHQGDLTVIASYGGGTFPFRVGYGTYASFTPTFAIADTGDVDIKGDLILHNVSNAPYIDFVEDADTADSKARITMDQVDTDNGTLIFSTEGSGTLSERMRIDSSGNVLVGASNSDIGGSVTGIKFTKDGMISASDDATGDTSSVVYLDRRGTNNEGKVLMFGMGGFLKAGIGVVGTSANTNDGGITFQTIGTNPATYDERMRIDSSGRVGIGMTPSDYTGYMLQINGTTQALMSFGNSTTGTGALNGLIIGNDATGADIYQREAQPLRFHTNNTERMRIDSSGQIMIRRTADYDGSNLYCLQVGDASVDNHTPIVCTVASTASRNQIVFSNNSSNNVGQISTSGSATAYNTSSDYRLKEDLQDFNGLDKVCKISVYDFKWKEYDSRSYGVMAHELEEVLPQAVNGEKDAEEMQSVDYSKIVPLLVKSIQELKAEVDELKKNCNCCK